MTDLEATFIFCDDLRIEIGGKTTLVGVYRGFLALPEGAPPLPKLVAVAMLSYPPSRVGSTGTIRLVDRGTVVVDGPVTLPASPSQDPSIHAQAEVDGVAFATMPIELQGFPAEHGSKLHLELEFGDKHIISPSLTILRVPNRGAPH